MKTMTPNPLFKMGLIEAPISIEGRDGKTLVDLRELGLFSAILGSRRSGYHTEADLVSVTSDGIDLNAMWAEFQATLAIFNERRARLVGILTYPVTQLIERVPQVGDTEFELASEFGVPQSARVTLDYFEMAYDFTDYDLATRYTWKYLRDADARQVGAVHEAILGADSRLIFRKVMEALFDNRNRIADIRGQNYSVYALYNGDGTIPPTYKSNVFAGTHTHYLTSASALVDSGDLEEMIEHIAHHGYGSDRGTTFVFMMGRSVAQQVRKFRAGAVNNNTVTANYDFIPAATEPTLIVPNSDGLLGSRPPATWNGLRVFGSYANALLIEEDYIPLDYLLCLGSGGEGDLQNPVGLREHANVDYRGLRLLPGNQQRYPLVDSYYSRGFGSGIRQRAGAVIMQFNNAGVYAPPVGYTRGGGLL